MCYLQGWMITAPIYRKMCVVYCHSPISASYSIFNVLSKEPTYWIINTGMLKRESERGSNEDSGITFSRPRVGCLPNFLHFFSGRLVPWWVLFIYGYTSVLKAVTNCVMVILTPCSLFRNPVRELFSPWRWEVCDCSSYEGTLLRAMEALLYTVGADVGQERRHLSCHDLSKLNSQQWWMIISLYP